MVNKNGLIKKTDRAIAIGEFKMGWSKRPGPNDSITIGPSYIKPGPMAIHTPSGPAIGCQPIIYIYSAHFTQNLSFYWKLWVSYEVQGSLRCKKTKNLDRQSRPNRMVNRLLPSRLRNRIGVLFFRIPFSATSDWDPPIRSGPSTCPDQTVQTYSSLFFSCYPFCLIHANLHRWLSSSDGYAPPRHLKQFKPISVGFLNYFCVLQEF